MHTNDSGAVTAPAHAAPPGDPRPRARRAYVTPRLLEFGNIATLTQQGLDPGFDGVIGSGEQV